MMSSTALVIREKEKLMVDSLTLTPGDIIILQPGDIIPADSKIIKQVNLEVLESALTGESHAVSKEIISNINITDSLADRKCILYSGSQVLKGTSTAIVIATGLNCEIGKISGLLSNIKPNKTPLLLQLEKFGQILSIIIIIIAIITFTIAYIHNNYSLDGA